MTGGTSGPLSRSGPDVHAAKIQEIMKSDKLLIELNSVRKRFGNVEVLNNIDLALRDGEFMTILGPSGSGKTTILRMIGGFTKTSGGSILLDGRDIAATPINRRPFNTVFQDYALFPHMTVAKNIGYGLQVKKTPRAELKKRVAETLELVQLTEFASRYPAQLSGGQRQRVALARAIVCQPRLILLDEPLAALDVALRRQMQLFLKDIQKKIRTTFLFVTHDQEEAIAMSDRICVMNFGKIQQVGSPHDVYYRPQTEFVARFFGDNNLLAGRLVAGDGDTRKIETPVGTFACAVDGQPDLKSAETGRKAFAVFRPEAITIGAPDKAAENQCAGVVTSISFAGDTTVAEVFAGEGEARTGLHVKLPSRIAGVALKSGDRVALNWKAEECRLVFA